MVSPRKRKPVVRNLRSSPNSKEDPADDWVAAGSFQFEQSPVFLRRGLKEKKAMNSPKNQKRRQSLLLKRLDIQMTSSPGSNMRRTRRQSIARMTGTSRLSIAPKMDPPKQAPPKMTRTTSRKRTDQVSSPNKNDATKLSKLPPKPVAPRKINSPKSKVPSNVQITPEKIVSIRSAATPKSAQKRKADSEVNISLKKSKTDSSLVVHSEKNLQKVKSPSPIKKRLLRSAIPLKTSNPVMRGTSKSPQKTSNLPPKSPEKVKKEETKKTRSSQSQPNLKSIDMAKAEKLSKGKTPSKAKKQTSSSSPKLSVSPKELKLHTPAKKMVSPKVSGSASQKKSKVTRAVAAEKIKTPSPKKETISQKPASPAPRKLQGTKTPKPISKTPESSKKTTAEVKTPEISIKTFYSPKKTTSAAKKAKMSAALKRLGSPSIKPFRATRSSSKKRPQKVVMLGASPKPHTSSYRKTPSSKRAIKNIEIIDDTDKEETEIEDVGASPILTARSQLELIRCRSPLRMKKRSPKKNANPFTPRPDSPPSHVLRKTMKNKVAQKMHSTTKVEVHQLMNSDISQPVKFISASKSVTKSISVTQSQSRKPLISVTPRKSLLDSIDGRMSVNGSTPVSESNLPPTPKSSRKTAEILNSSRVSMSRTATKSISCHRSLLGATPRSSTPIEEDDSNVGEVVEKVVKENNFTDDSINTDISEDDIALNLSNNEESPASENVESTQLLEKTAESPVSEKKRSYCSVM